MKKIFFCFCISVLICPVLVHSVYSQVPETAKSRIPPPSGSGKKNTSGSGKRTPKNSPRASQPKPKTPLASTTLNVLPADSTITLKQITNNSSKKNRAENPVTYNPSSGQTLSNITPGDYEVIVTNKDYQERKIKLTLAPGDNNFESIKLAPKPGKLSLIINTANSEPLKSTPFVTLRNKNNGNTIDLFNPRFKQDIPPGDYDLKVVAKGYKTKEVPISIMPNADLLVVPDLVENTPPPVPVVTEPDTSRCADNLAEIIKKEDPDLSDSTKRLNIFGTVTVIVMVDDEGGVVTAKAIDGPSPLRKASENAARKHKFSPAKRNGEAIYSLFYLVFNFQRK